jgi:hypothetical protein
MPVFQQPEEETEKRARVIGRVVWVLLKHWKTNGMLVIVIWYSWKEKFWQDRLYRFTFPLAALLCSLPLLDDLIEYYREKRSATSQADSSRSAQSR